MNLGVQNRVKNRMGNSNLETETAKRRSDVVDWLNTLFPDLDIPAAASEEELRARLYDGTVLCGVLNRLNLDSLESPREVYDASEQRLEYVKWFLSAMDGMGLPGFNLVDLEQGSLSPVVECLLSLKDNLSFEPGEDGIYAMENNGNQLRKRWELPEGDESAAMGAERRNFSGLKLQQVLQSPVVSESSTPSFHHLGCNFHDVLQLKQGRCSDLPAAKISEILKSSSLNNAPTQSLLGIVNGILDESMERKNVEVPQRVACLLKKLVKEIEQRLASQAEHIRNLNNLIKAREEKYKSRIRVLKTLANGTNEETQIVMNQLQVLKMEKLKVEEKKKLEEQDVARLMKAKEDRDQFIAELKQKLDVTNKMYEHRCQQFESQARETTLHLNQRIKELEFLLEDSRKRIRELEASSESKFQNYNKREIVFQNFIGLQLQSLEDLRISSESIKGEVINSQMRWQEEMANLGLKLKVLVDAAGNYHTVIAENQRLYNEIQELKGNIRVYCRIRPFLPGQSKKLTTIDYFGENGELLVGNPFKQGKDGHRLFKFNKVFGPVASQEEVFSDIQPLIRSVLDGYNVCIFAYGQTGSGKTFTMSGPHSAPKEDWGVNYRALNDLFEISRNRRNTSIYEVGVQMVEIYNEQVRDLLSSDGSQKRLGIWSTSQPNGLAVPDASMLPVKSTSDVLELMQIGQANRAVGSTALNERSSRSHSILTVHIRGVDLKTGSTSRGCLHLIDLAGSERVERSEATGDRLKEAQHINRSLSSLGDVISALAQKSSHVPYRNSKLTQVLQSSLGGQAKTLMFVQINPDIESYSETISTLKFAERVSGVELGAARSNKEGKDVRDLLEQVASLKDTIARKDEEIEQLKLLKDHRLHSPSANNEKCDRYGMKHSSSSLGIPHLGGTTQPSQQVSCSRLVKPIHKAASEPDNCSENSDNTCEINGGNTVRYVHANVEPLGFGEADSDERLSEMSDGGLSVGTETDVSVSSAPESTSFYEAHKPDKAMAQKTGKVSSRLPRLFPSKAGPGTSTRPKLKDPTKSPSTRKSTTAQATGSSAKPAKPWV